MVTALLKTSIDKIFMPTSTTLRYLSSAQKLPTCDMIVIFLLVWDFGGRLFDLFLEPLFGLKSRPFLTPKAVPNQRENYHDMTCDMSTARKFDCQNNK